MFDPALRERHIGDLQGMKLQDAATERPEAYKAFMSRKRNQQIPVSVLITYRQVLCLALLHTLRCVEACMSNVKDFLKHR